MCNECNKDSILNKTNSPESVIMFTGHLNGNAGILKRLLNAIKIKGAG